MELPSNAEGKRGGRVLALDILRFGAALVVFVQHFLAMFDSIPGPAYLRYGILDGKGAVTLFFVLSGYVLAASLYSSPASVASYVKFGVRRAFRIYPLWWCALLLSLAVLSSLRFSEHFTNPPAGDGALGSAFLEQEGWQVKQWLWQFTLIGPGMYSYFAIPPVWTLMAEANIAVIFPLIAWMFVRNRKLAFLVLAGLILGSGWLGKHVVGTLSLVGLFGLGAALHQIPKGFEKKFTSIGWIGLFVVSIGLCYGISLPYAQPIRYYTCGFGCAGLIWMSVYCPAMRHGMDSVQRAIKYDLSFGIYILHQPVFMYLRKMWLDQDLVLPLWGYMILAFVIVFPLAWLLHLMIELPAIRWAKRLTQ